MLYQQRQIRQSVFRRFQRSGRLLVAVLKLRDLLLQIGIVGNTVLVEKYHCAGGAFQVFNFCPAFIACGLLRLDAVFNVNQQRHAAALRLRRFQNDLALDAFGYGFLGVGFTQRLCTGESLLTGSAE